MLESVYQRKLIKEIERRFPGCVVLKNDSSYIQGIPDLTILYMGDWAVLEVKSRSNAPHEPNQDHYVERLNNMGFAAFICPENQEEILDAVHQAFEARR